MTTSVSIIPTAHENNWMTIIIAFSNTITHIGKVDIKYFRHIRWLRTIPATYGVSLLTYCRQVDTVCEKCPISRRIGTLELHKTCMVSDTCSIILKQLLLAHSKGNVHVLTIFPPVSHCSLTDHCLCRLSILHYHQLQS